ncbi:MAG: YdcF family protein, partial [Pedosphaera sp.]|nr:YdcF family protein [Pedosphaera sp.]
IFLVTSAWHMPRARAVFESSGVRVIPVGCDFRSIPKGKLKVFPSSGRLESLQIFLQEKVGWMYYRSKGWIRLEGLSGE